MTDELAVSAPTVDDLDPDAVSFNRPASEDDIDALALDLSEVDERNTFEIIPPGMYNVIVHEDSQYGPSSNGNPMITWVLEITDGEYQGRKVYWHNVLNKEHGIKALKRMLLRVAPNRTDLLSNFRPAIHYVELIGLPAKVKVRVRTQDGERRNNVSDIFPPDNQAGGFLDA